MTRLEIRTPGSIQGKAIAFDILAEDDLGRPCDVAMQVRNLEAYPPRSPYLFGQDLRRAASARRA